VRRKAHMETVMKITVIKKSNGKVKSMAICAWFVDEPPMGQNQK